MPSVLPDVILAGARKLSERVAMFRIPSLERPAIIDEDGEWRYCEVTFVDRQSECKTRERSLLAHGSPLEEEISYL